MKIISLQAENVKRLHAVNLDIDGTLQVIGGNNAQGKTSVLDAIWLALGGGSASRDTDRPIRDGEQTAHATVTLDDLIVTRTWTADGKTTVKVTTPDGAAYKSPQSLLNDLVANVGIDPLAFVRMDAKTQRDTLLSLVELPFDPAELARKRAAAYAERTETNTARKQYDGQLAGMPERDDTIEHVDVAELAHQHAELSAAQQRRARLLDDIARSEREIGDAKRQLENANRHYQEAADALTNSADYTDDLDDVAEQMRDAEQINRAAGDQTARRNVEVLRNKCKAESDDLTTYINDLDRQKADGLAAAHMPTPDLGFDDQGVTLAGVPFKQASSAEQIRASIAMGIALNPKLRTLFIRDGSLLDADSMTAIAEQAAENDYQIIMERVGTSDPGAIIIHDGQAIA